MKWSRNTVFTIISTIALLIVLILQVNWIIETAKYKREFFKEKETIILARTTEALSSDPELRLKLKTGTGKKEHLIIDSLLVHYMKYYNFHEPYTFEIIRFPQFVLAPYENPDQMACGQKSLNDLTSQNGWKLVLHFPKKQEFIWREMGLPFLSSVVLIVLVLVLFWRTVVSLMKEKRISEHSTDFLNNMTHEFKTPLTNIALAGKMIMKDNQDAKTKHYSGIILEENEKLRLQIEQVLSMTALERGEIPVQKTELDFHQLLNDAVKSMALQIEHAQGIIKLDLKAEQFVVMGDPTHLTNAICNLIDNALKYAKGIPDISIHTHNTDKNLVIVFSDKGIGIEKEYQKKVFEKYFRIPKGNIHDVKGFGLGLAYVKKIIELHEGTIDLDSSKENGTVFTIILPND